MNIPGTSNNSFAQKALIVLMGAFAAVLMAFFVWLATAIIDIRERVVKIELNVASLLETRMTDAAEDTATNARRIERLEKSEAGE